MAALFGLFGLTCSSSWFALVSGVIALFSREEKYMYTSHSDTEKGERGVFFLRAKRAKTALEKTDSPFSLP